MDKITSDSGTRALKSVMIESLCSEKPACTPPVSVLPLKQRGNRMDICNGLLMPSQPCWLYKERKKEEDLWCNGCCIFFFFFFLDTSRK